MTFHEYNSIPFGQMPSSNAKKNIFNGREPWSSGYEKETHVPRVVGSNSGIDPGQEIFHIYLL